FYVRLNVAFSWFDAATVTIDGVAPSTLGLHTGLDTLSCNAIDHGLLGDGYVDVLVADGLSAGSHTCIITIDSPESGAFFSLAGFKVVGFPSLALPRSGGWIMPAPTLLTQNKTTLAVTTRADTPIEVVAVTFPTTLRDPITAGALTTL